jgi:hypothetical protein
MPAAAHAQQAALAGVVRDSSGAVLPGVTVEASSPALIEKARSAVTDATGNYQIIELNPGTYSLTFTLSGFATVKRENVEVSGTNVITINAELRVGQVSETVTVTGETPVVDVQATKRENVLEQNVIETIPAARGASNLLAIVPAITGSANTSSSSTPFVAFFSTHGGPANEGNIQYDSLPVGAAFNGGGTSGNAYDTFNAAELQITVSGSLGEAETGGPILNIVPKTGGNSFKGSGFYTQAGQWAQANNIDAALQAAGITQAGLQKLWDYNIAVGGPIQKDKLWFYANYRDVGSWTAVPGQYANLYAGDPNHWDYAPNKAVQGTFPTSKTDYQLRLDNQLTPRNKLSYRIDYQKDCDGTSLSMSAGCRTAGSDYVGSNAFSLPFISPEAESNYWDSHEIIQTATWSSPVTNKLLLDAGFSSFISHWGWMQRPGGIYNLTQVTQIVPFLEVYRGDDNIIENYQDPLRWRASASYVTGSHNIKVGYTGAYNIEETTDLQGQPYTLTNLGFVCGGCPLWQATMRIAPWYQSHRTWSNGVYGQDQWTIGKFTLQGALRYDRASSFFPSDHNGSPGNIWTNYQPINFPETQGVTGYNDLSYRGGVAWDIFGTGKTSLKVFAGKYLQNADNQANYIISAPTLDGRNGRQNLNFQTTANRLFLDLNGNHVPDCNLLENAPNGECIASDLGGFGQLSGVTKVDPNVLHGWGVRPYDNQWNISIQQEILPRTSVELGYFYRSFHNFFVTYNQNLQPSSAQCQALGGSCFEPYQFNAPNDPNLGSQSGQQVTYVIPKAGVNINNISNVYTSVATLTGNDSNWSNSWNGVDFSITARAQHGVTVNFGTSTGRATVNWCAVAGKAPDLFNPVLTGGPGAAPLGFSNGIFELGNSCSYQEKWQTSAKGIVSYTIPKWDLLLSAAFRSSPNVTFGFGATPEGNSAGLSANLPQAANGNAGYGFDMLPPGQFYGPRVNITDLRFGKYLKFGRTRTNVALDLINLFNTNTTTNFQTTYTQGPGGYLTPLGIVSARVAKINVTVDF